MKNDDLRPAMFKEGKTLFLTIAYPPNPAAAAVVHRHLLDQFDPNSFWVITGFFPGAKRAEVPKNVHLHFIYLSFEFISSKIHKVLARIQRFTLPVMLNMYISILKPKRIIICYPDLYWLDVCSKVAINRKIPFIPYLHDTVEEGTYFSKSKELAKTVQARIFKHAYRISVMSEGMKTLYKQKYNLDTTAWEHIYPEKPVTFNGVKDNRAHWSGDVYEINYKAVVRLNSALEKLGMQFSISNGKTREQLQNFGVTGNHVQKIFFPKRADYLQSLSAAKIVLLGLNFSDECNVHEDELASIFSTKTPEYLGSDTLIVYHGPKHYFLAQFLIKNDCGIVIDTKNVDELFLALKEVMDHYSEHEYKIKNAAKSLSIFNADLVANKLIETLDV